MTDRVDIVNLADLELYDVKRGSRFEVGVNDIDRPLGLAGLGATLHVVPAGKTAWPYHRHHGNDELFVILDGAGEYRVGERRLPIRAGDCIGAPAGGEAHQIINTSAAELRYLAIANRTGADVIDYPDSGKISISLMHDNDKHPRTFIDIRGRLTEAGYWDGEEIGEEPGERGRDA